MPSAAGGIPEDVFSRGTRCATRTRTVDGGITTITPAAFEITALSGHNVTAQGGITYVAPAGMTVIAPGTTFVLSRVVDGS